MPLSGGLFLDRKGSWERFEYPVATSYPEEAPRRAADLPPKPKPSRYPTLMEISEHLRAELAGAGVWMGHDFAVQLCAYYVDEAEAKLKALHDARCIPPSMLHA